MILPMRRMGGTGALTDLAAEDVTFSSPVFAEWQETGYIRTHDVATVRDAFTLLAAITRQAGQM